MVFRGPESRLGAAVAVMLVAALAACGSDPPDGPRPDGRQAGGEAFATVPTATAVARQFVSPVEPPSALVMPLEKPLPLAVASVGPAPLVSYPPTDECAKLPGFATFRDTVFAAVARRDAAALAALADPAVNLDFGGGSGPDELRKRLTASPVLWGELAALEGLGCAEDGGVVTLPWIFSRMPDSVDPYSALLVTGRGVPLRAKPVADAKELAKLDWMLVEATTPPDEAAFREVNSGKLRGFVEGGKLRIVIGYRLIADRQNGEWKITAFVAGD